MVLYLKAARLRQTFYVPLCISAVCHVCASSWENTERQRDWATRCYVPHGANKPNALLTIPSAVLKTSSQSADRNACSLWCWRGTTRNPCTQVRKYTLYTNTKCLSFKVVIRVSAGVQQVASFSPWGLTCRCLQVSGDVQKVKTEENSPLKKQEEETDAVPNNARLLHGQRALFITHGVSCEKHKHINTSHTSGWHEEIWEDFYIWGFLWLILTVVVSFDGTHQTEELYDPAEVLLHLHHKHTGQDLTEQQHVSTHHTAAGTPSVC